MKKLRPLLLCICSLLLCACGVQIQLQTLEPAQTNLRRGSLLRVYALQYNDASRRLSKKLNEYFRDSGFFKLGGTGATLYIEQAYESTDIYTNHTCSSSEECTCSSTIETTVSATVYLAYKGRILYHRSLSDTSYSGFANYDYLAREIVNDLVPHTVTYSVRIKPQRGNDILEQAAESCRRGDWSGGKSLAKASLQSHPNDPEAYYLLGIIARHHGQYRASNDYFSRAAAIKPSTRYTRAIEDNAQIREKENLARAQLNG